MTTYRWQDPKPPAAASIVQRRKRRVLVQELRNLKWQKVMVLHQLPKSAYACDEAAIEKAVTRAVERAMAARQFSRLGDLQ